MTHLLKVIVIAGSRMSDWREATVANTLDALQGLVGGPIQALPLNPTRAVVYVNSEGKVRDLDVSSVLVMGARVVDYVCGPAVIAGPIDANGDVTDVTDEALAYVKQHVAQGHDMPWGDLILAQEAQA